MNSKQKLYDVIVYPNNTVGNPGGLVATTLIVKYNERSNIDKIKEKADKKDIRC